MNSTIRKSSKKGKQVQISNQISNKNEEVKANDKRTTFICLILVLGIFSLYFILFPSQKSNSREVKRIPSFDELLHNKQKLLPFRFKTELEVDKNLPTYKKVKETWTILDVRNGLFGPLMAIERKGAVNNYRALVSGKSFIGGMHLVDKSSLFAAFFVQSAAIFANPTGKTLLQIGLGIGFVSKHYFSTYGMKSDIIEIDENVLQMAINYFDYQSNLYNNLVFIQDALSLLSSSSLNRSYYDFVIHDVYSGGKTTPKLITREVFRSINDILVKKDSSHPNHGLLVFNFLGYLKGENNTGFKMAWKTLKSVFAHVRCFTATQEHETDHFSDAIFFASQDPIEFHIPEEFFNYQMNPMDFYWVLTHFTQFEIYEDNLFVNDKDNIPIITDANVEHLKELQVDVETQLSEIVHQLLPEQILSLLK